MPISVGCLNEIALLLGFHRSLTFILRWFLAIIHLILRRFFWICSHLQCISPLMRFIHVPNWFEILWGSQSFHTVPRIIYVLIHFRLFIPSEIAPNSHSVFVRYMGIILFISFRFPVISQSFKVFHRSNTFSVGNLKWHVPI